MKLTSARTYLKTEDIKQGDTITILDGGEFVASAKYTYNDGTPRKDLLFKIKHNDKELSMRLNATNKKTLVAAFGDDTDAWVGKIVKLDVANVMVSGKMMKTIIMQPVGGKSADYEA